MSKPKDTPKLADWEVTHWQGTVTIAQSWYSVRKDGGTTFHDEQGICYDFPPGCVTIIRRLPGPADPSETDR